MGYIGPYNRENGIQVGLYALFLLVSLYVQETMITEPFYVVLCGIGQEEMNQLLRERLCLMRIARLLYLLWTSSKNYNVLNLSSVQLQSSGGLNLFCKLIYMMFLTFCVSVDCQSMMDAAFVSFFWTYNQQLVKLLTAGQKSLFNGLHKILGHHRKGITSSVLRLLVQLELGCQPYSMFSRLVTLPLSSLFHALSLWKVQLLCKINFYLFFISYTVVQCVIAYDNFLSYLRPSI